MTQSAVPSPARGGAPRGDGTMIDRHQLAALRGMLEQQRRFRLDQIEQLQRAETSSGAEREVSASLLAGARSALRDVLDALQRMADGRYGTCRHCGERLPIERLEVLPQVGLCMPCQRAAQGV